MTLIVLFQPIAASTVQDLLPGLRASSPAARISAFAQLLPDDFLPRCAAPMAALFEVLKGRCTGRSIIDATPLAVCDNPRIRGHRIFAGHAARGKTSTG